MTTSSLADEMMLSDAKKKYTYEPRGKNRSRYTVLANEDVPRRILIYRAPYIITVDDKNKLRYLRDMSVLIHDGIIVDVLKGSKKIDLNALDLMYDASRRGGIILTPGLVNAHAHPPMYLLRSTLIENSLQMLESALRGMAELEGKMRHDDFFIGALGDFTEEQKMGITTTLSHYGVFTPIDDAARVAHHRVINALSAVSNSHPKNSPKLVARHIGGDTWTTPAIALHYAYKASDKQLRAIAKLQHRHGVLLTLHCAESPHVAQISKERFGISEVEALDTFGLLNERTVLSHCVHVSGEDIALIKKRKAVVVHLPTSNKMHKSGEFPYPAFARAKALDRIALGTDSVISKNKLDLLSEALQTRIMHQDKKIVPFELLFRMMTSQAADLLGLNVGRIQKGYKADIAFWKIRDRGFIPFNKQQPSTLVANLITYGGRNIRDLMIDGKFVVSNRVHNLVNESKLLDALQGRHEILRG